jgi:hypothetical protein
VSAPNALVVESRADPIRSAVPVRFGVPGGPLLEVADVLDWWPGEGYHYFRVLVGEGAEYGLRHDLETDTWRFHYFLLTSGREERH